MDDHTRILEEFFKTVDEQIATGEVRMVFWRCSTPWHRFVTWTHCNGISTPRCDECGETGEPR